MIEIKQIYNKEQYIDLLLEADPEKDIVEKYVDDKTGKDVSIPNDLRRKIDAKAKKIMNKYYQGTKIVITDLDYIFENL